MPADLETHDYTSAALPCDVVMKGGITSGVVYPLAICELAREFRFRNVGGTSAGAIAAAATAAAEYGRERRGFNRLAKLPAWISGNITSLFQPQEATYDLFAMLLAAVSPGTGPERSRWILSAAVAGFPWTALLGLSPGVALFVLGLLDLIDGGAGGLNVVALAVGPLLALLGLALALAGRVAQVALRAIPANGYGMCSGFAPEDRQGARPLTTWLHHELNRYARLDEDAVLTFGDLRMGPPDRPPRDDGEPFVNLEMMTTNLTNRTALRLPLDPTGWFFDEAEFRALFPKAVVDRMLPPKDRRGHVEVPREGLWPWPAPDDLPVIVATRMSLSFPVLLSAIPLWRVDDDLAERAGVPEAEHCWFSDGGIASNFPVHFFDGIVPRWPTFAINLRPFPLGDGQESPSEPDNVVMMRSESEPLGEWWYREPNCRLMKLPGFLSGIGHTMQNRVDEAQMRVPGYRDRVVHVQLTRQEGGMNLAMDDEVIGRLTERGRIAGERLAQAYGPEPPGGQRITWLGHRWTRLRSSLAALEGMLKKADRGYRSPPRPGEPTYAELVARGYGVPGTGPALSDAQRKVVEDLTGDAERVSRDAAGDASLARGAPAPAPEGRIVPSDRPTTMSEPATGDS